MLINNIIKLIKQYKNICLGTCCIKNNHLPIRIKIFGIKYAKIVDMDNYNTLSFKHYSTVVFIQVILYNYVKQILNKLKSFYDEDLKTF